MLWSLLCAAIPLLQPSLARAEPPLPSADRIMLVVAHQDDNMMIMVPDLRNALRAGKAVQTVFVTSGDAGFTCDAYTKGREQGAKVALAHLLGVESRWSEEERSVNGKRVRFSSLAGTAVSFAHIGLPNPALFSSEPPEGALAKLWSREIAQVSTLPFDGRTRLDAYTREDLIEVLRALMVQFAPKDVRILDASQQQLPYYPFEHVDHMGSAMFAMAAFQRYTLADSLTFYPLYSVLFKPENLDSASAALRSELFDAYRQYDPAPCATESALTTTICGETTLCDPLFLYQPLWPRSYPDDTLRGTNKLLRTPGGACLDVVGGAVVASPCNPLRVSQRWELSRGGAVRNMGASKCLAAANANAGQPLSLRSCAREPSQQFYLTTERQLRGPDATCVQEWFGQALLAECAPDDAQLGFVLQ